MKRSKAIKYRRSIEHAATLLPDVDALNAVAMFPAWRPDGHYNKDDRVREGNTLYRCMQTHDAQPGWNPAAGGYLWSEVLIPDETKVPEWKQPDYSNTYKKGDRVTHNGQTWESDIDGNSWEPGVYGWHAVK